MHSRERIALSKELNNILDKLLNDIHTYYSKNLVLNSEGMKLLSRAIKIIIKLYPELRPLITKVRLNPNYDSIIKLALRIEEFKESLS